MDFRTNYRAKEHQIPLNEKVAKHRKAAHSKF